MATMAVRTMPEAAPAAEDAAAVEELRAEIAGLRERAAGLVGALVGRPADQVPGALPGWLTDIPPGIRDDPARVAEFVRMQLDRVVCDEKPIRRPTRTAAEAREQMIRDGIDPNERVGNKILAEMRGRSG